MKQIDDNSYNRPTPSFRKQTFDAASKIQNLSFTQRTTIGNDLVQSKLDASGSFVSHQLSHIPNPKKGDSMMKLSSANLRPSTYFNNKENSSSNNNKIDSPSST